MYKCTLCNEQVESDLLVYHGHVEKHIVEMIQKKNPNWTEKDGMCQKCIEYLRAQLKGTPFADDSAKPKGLMARLRGIFGK